MTRKSLRPALLASTAMLLAASPAVAAIKVQCPGDTNGDGIISGSETLAAGQKCLHLSAGDGFINMADVSRNPNGARGKLQYVFGFSDVTDVPAVDVTTAAAGHASLAAPTIVVDEGDEVYLTLSNIGFVQRPDLFDPHSVHWHGFPNASAIFDGVPEASISTNPSASMTYYYKVSEPGTYMYHCHVEATEHMQMGMLGNLYVRPQQNRLPAGTVLGSHNHAAGDTYVYNDGDGSTRYDVDYPIQIHSFDPDFHDASMTVQPLPFALMKDTYPMLNGRGYPDTVNPQPLANSENGAVSQPLPALIEATAGQRILLRLSNLSVTRFYTLTASGLPMQVVGHGARILKGGGLPAGRPLYYKTLSVTLGGGEARDVIIDTTGIAPGTYLLHATELYYMSNHHGD